MCGLDTRISSAKDLISENCVVSNPSTRQEQGKTAYLSHHVGQNPRTIEPGAGFFSTHHDPRRQIQLLRRRRHS